MKCCNDPTCEPHREARAELSKKQAILDGTDYITRTANAKRASKVSPGSFYDTNISYFGETVVIWNVHDFMKNDKWRDDAIRKSARNNNNNKGVVAELSHVKRNKRKRSTKKGNDDDDNSEEESKKKKGEEGKEEEYLADSSIIIGQVESGKKIKKKPLLSRKKRFDAICAQLYQQSLAK